MKSHEVKLSDGRTVFISNKGDHWKFQMFNENNLIEDTYEEDTSKTIDPGEQRAANMLSRVSGTIIGPKFPNCQDWLDKKHEVGLDDGIKIGTIIAEIMIGGIKDFLNE
jgi:hypothetical protein